MPLPDWLYVKYWNAANLCESWISSGCTHKMHHVYVRMRRHPCITLRDEWPACMIWYARITHSSTISHPNVKMSTYMHMHIWAYLLHLLICIYVVMCTHTEWILHRKEEACVSQKCCRLHPIDMRVCTSMYSACTSIYSACTWQHRYTVHVNDSNDIQCMRMIATTYQPCTVRANDNNDVQCM